MYIFLNFSELLINYFPRYIIKKKRITNLQLCFWSTMSFCPVLKKGRRGIGARASASRLDQDGHLIHCIWKSEWIARCSSLVPSASRLAFFWLIFLLFPHYLCRKIESLNQTPNYKNLYPNSVCLSLTLQSCIDQISPWRYYFALVSVVFAVFHLIFLNYCFPFRLHLQKVFRFYLFKISLSGKKSRRILIFVFDLECYFSSFSYSGMIRIYNFLKMNIH